MMGNGIMSGAILSWVAIVTELSSAIILYNNRNITLTMSAYVAISRGNYGLASAFSAILTVLTALSLLLYLAITRSEDIKLLCPTGAARAKIHHFIKGGTVL